MAMRRDCPRLALAVLAVLGLVETLAVSSAARADFDPPACGASPFSDVTAAHPFCEWIQQLEADQVTTGCGGGKYCPDAPVTHAQLAMFLERAMRGTAEWDPWEGSYRRTLVVNPVLTGDPPVVDWVASGTRLIEILNAIPEIGTPLIDPWLVIVEPGIYDIGAQTFTNDVLPLTIRGAGNFRSVIYTTAAVGAVFTNNPGGSLDLEDVNFTVSGPGAGSLTAIQNTGLLELTRARIDVNGQGDTYAVRVEGSGSMSAADSFLTAGTATSEAAAVFVNGDSGRLFLRNTIATGTGGNQARGVLVDDGEATIIDSEMDANSAANTNYGLALENGALGIVRGGGTTASSGTAIGLYVEDSVLRVDGGSFSGNTRALQCLHIALSSDAFVTRASLGGPISLRSSAQCPITATFSALGGPVTLNGGVINCRAVTDAANNFLATTCP